jgi:hypothetical protein
MLKEVMFHRPEIDRIAPVYHGAFVFNALENLKLTPEAVVDFSVNTTPSAPHPR